MVDKEKGSPQNSDEYKDAGEHPDEASNAIFKLLETTIKSGFKLIDIAIKGAKKSQNQMSQLLQGTLPESLTLNMKEASEQIREEMQNHSSDFFSQFVIVSREEVDQLKLDVIKLKAQVKKLNQQEKKEFDDEDLT